MCGRFRRRSDKEKVAKTFAVTAGLDETDFESGDDFSPQSMQPVIYQNADGERQLELMRWGFNLPDRLLFNARSEGIRIFRSGRMLSHRPISAPADAVFEWVRPESRPDDCPARSRDRTCRPIGSTLRGQASWQRLVEKPSDNVAAAARLLSAP